MPMDIKAQTKDTHKCKVNVNILNQVVSLYSR